MILGNEFMLYIVLNPLGKKEEGKAAAGPHAYKLTGH